MQSDIIEIDICLLDVQSEEITGNRGLMVKPEQFTIQSILHKANHHHTGNIKAD